MLFADLGMVSGMVSFISSDERVSQSYMTEAVTGD